MKWQDLKSPDKHAFEWVWRRDFWKVLTGYAFISLHPRKSQNPLLFAFLSCWCICCCWCCSSFVNISLASITSHMDWRLETLENLEFQHCNGTPKAPSSVDSGAASFLSIITQNKNHFWTTQFLSVVSCASNKLAFS